MFSLSSRDGFMRVLNQNPLGGTIAVRLQGTHLDRYSLAATTAPSSDAAIGLTTAHLVLVRFAADYLHRLGRRPFFSTILKMSEP